ncbi:MAG: tetratricopeptide repeat protein, partial [Elusimicrobiaceae bacterium]|nr:tetratricopeptide repeat protein [Elusimicrobiaceae bacterium]
MQETETYIGTEYNMEPERPKFADYFEILGDNENGGMGEVYFCRDKRSGQLYALKKAKADPKYEAVLKQEAAFALELGKHPNIVYTATIGHEGDMYYIVMELIGQTDGPRPQGNTLVNEFNKHHEGLPVEQAYQWAIEFCEGMKYLNSKGMKAHKDIKPANLFITPEGHLKIGDFGLASVGENRGIGTKGYRAPEIKNGIYDVRTDIYAFGIVLYQLLNKGFNPLDNTQYTHVDTRMDTQDERAFPRADALKSRHGVDILRKCLQQNPSARYQTFTELEEDLIQALRTLNPQYQFTPAQEEPLNAEEYFGKGLGWAELTNFHKAIKNYDKAIELDPQYADAYNDRGNAKNDLKDYAGAIADYDKAIELDPKFAMAYNNRGVAKYNLKDYVGAMADYDKTIELDPQYAYAYNNRGVAKDELKDYAGAIADYDKAIELDPQTAKAYYKRGNAKYDANDYAGAMADYNKAIELDPKYAYAYDNRG